MTTSTAFRSKSFARAFTAVAVLGPILLTIVAGTLPEGTRGEFVVTGDILIVGALLAALALRVVYGMGFDKALKKAGTLMSSSPNRSLSA